MSMYNYPAPCSPGYKKPARIEDCLPQARQLVKKLAASERPPFLSVAPRFYIREGDRVLIVTLPDQDQYVADAVRQALLEQGAEKVDYIYPRELVGKDPDTYSVEDGWKEVVLLKEGKASGTLIDLVTGLGLGEATGKHLDEHPGYTRVFLDVGGANSRRALGKHGDKFGGFWPFNDWEWFIAKGQTFPLQVWGEFEKRIVEMLGEASEVRITDPEGTHLEFSLTAEQAKRWQNYALFAGHLRMNPLYATSGEVRERTGESLDAPPVFQEANGVLAGTSNHCGFYPRIEAYFERDRLVKVKGGGKYGDGIREMMERYRDIQWPGYPDKGYFWFCDTALCTAVGVHRRMSDMFNSFWVYPNLPERTRAGVFHLGFGSRYCRTEKEFNEFAQKHGLPRGHIHVHNYFATFEVKLRGSTCWEKIVDKGWITALSDPDIRAMASRYGQPEALLKYDWVPPLPGINCEGDYIQDYSSNPVAYLRKRIKENKSI
jgi:hypothetical protein